VQRTSPLCLGVLGSGKGSNFAAIAAAITSHRLPARIGIVLSDNPDAAILGLAADRGIPGKFIAPGRFRTKLDDESESAYLEALNEAGVDLVVLAGFMRVLKGQFLKHFEGRVVNIHPSLLPSFPGLSSWKQALDYGVKVTGCTVHFVDQGVDTGPIIAQRAVPVLDTDTPASLHERIQEAERELYPAALASIARGEVQVRGRLTHGFSDAR
jgi:phosphoribosylglycinamide formyltransferase-1